MVVPLLPRRQNSVQCYAFVRMMVWMSYYMVTWCPSLSPTVLLTSSLPMGKLLFCLVQMPLPRESLHSPLDGSASQVISRCLGDISN